MSSSAFSWVSIGRSAFAICTLTWLGCGTSTPEFSSNRIYLTLQQRNSDKVIAQQVADIATAVTALFGTPDEPYFVNDSNLSVAEVLDINNLSVAAGPITKDNYGKGQGLYRRHCVHCHGVTGDGRGPTAQFLNPYPRDFRKGIFKFKSTRKGRKPTNDDLSRIINHGIAGTAMPSFRASLKRGEIEAIIDYVKYLSIRGEVERQLMLYQCQESDYSDEEIEASRDDFLSTDVLVDQILSGVLDSWRSPEAEAVPARPEKYDLFSADYDEIEHGKSIDRGKTLYYGAGGCAKCHGPTQLGDGETTNYDDWTKEFYDWASAKNELYKERRSEYEALGGLKPRNIMPRNLRSGVYRGGRRPVDIFWRIRNSIDGTPMPAADPSIVDDDGVWDIVNFVLAVPYQKMSRAGDETSFSRERQ